MGQFDSLNCWKMLWQWMTSAVNMFKIWECLITRRSCSSVPSLLWMVSNVGNILLINAKNTTIAANSKIDGDDWTLSYGAVVTTENDGSQNIDAVLAKYNDNIIIHTRMPVDALEIIREDVVTMNGAFDNSHTRSHRVKCNPKDIRHLIRKHKINIYIATDL